jgi:hypothetical protein
MSASEELLKAPGWPAWAQGAGSGKAAFRLCEAADTDEIGIRWPTTGASKRFDIVR